MSIKSLLQLILLLLIFLIIGGIYFFYFYTGNNIQVFDTNNISKNEQKIINQDNETVEEVLEDIKIDNSKVLDVGCGDGELMNYIYNNITKDIRGIEISKKNVQKCIERGLTVIEGDAEKDLKQFPNSSFEYVILSQTLQAFLDPENVINELLRVGKKAIVTIPNFGFWKVRLHLLFKGTMPITKNLPNEWYNTPNLHMCSIKDFENYCNKRNIKINSSNLGYKLSLIHI